MFIIIIIIDSNLSFIPILAASSGSAYVIHTFLLNCDEGSPEVAHYLTDYELIPVQFMANAGNMEISFQKVVYSLMILAVVISMPIPLHRSYYLFLHYFLLFIYPELCLVSAPFLFIGCISHLQQKFVF